MARDQTLTGRRFTQKVEAKIYDHQETIILKSHGRRAMETANYGWGVDEIAGSVATKVYGVGVLTTSMNAAGFFEDDWDD